MHYSQIEPLEARIAPATVSISGPSPVNEGDSGKSDATFTITLSEATSGPVTVHYSTTPGTATGSGAFPDYEGQSGTVTFDPADFVPNQPITKTVTVKVLGDTRREGNETFSVVLSDPNGASLGSTPSASATINEEGSDKLGVTITGPATDIAEGNSGRTQAVFTVTLDEAVPAGGSVKVNYGTNNNTAISSGAFPDFVAKSGSLVFGPGEKTKTISVDVLGDNYKEGDETFSVTLSDPSNLGILDPTNGTASAKIISEAADTKFGVAITGATEVTEADSGSTPVTYTIELSGPATAPITVKYKVAAGTASDSGPFVDYTVGDVQDGTTGAATGTMTFAVGQQSKTIKVNVTGDPYKEPNETYSVALSDLTGDNTLFGATSVTTSIEDPNNIDTEIGVAITPVVAVTEGTGVQAKFTVTLAGAVTKPFTIDYFTGATTDTAKPGPGAFTDYTTKTGTLTFAAGGALSQDVYVSLLNDTYKEAAESFTVGLKNATFNGETLTTSNGTNGVKIGTLTPGRADITDDGDTTIGIAIRDLPNIAEGDTQTNPGTPPPATVPVTSTASFAVELSAPVTEAVTLKYSTHSGTASSSGPFIDFVSETDHTISIAPDTVATTATVTINGDIYQELDESFTVVLSDLDGGGVVMADDTATGTIKSEPTDLKIGVNVANAAPVTEGGQPTSDFVVTLAGPLSSKFTIDYATGVSTDTAKPAPGAFTDYFAKNGTLTFNPGDVTKTVSVALIDDDFKEADETFSLTLSNGQVGNNLQKTSSGGQTTVALNTGSGDPSTTGSTVATAQILNGSDATIGLALLDSKIVEGNPTNTAGTKTMNFTAVLSSPLTHNLVLTVNSQNGTAIAGSDYLALTKDQTVTIAANTTSQTIPVTIGMDSDFEATESFFINVTNVTGDATDLSTLGYANQTPLSSTAKLTARGYIYNDDVNVISNNKVQWVDVDGDLVTMTINKGSLPLTNTTLFTFAEFNDAGSVVADGGSVVNGIGGRILQKLDLSSFGTTFAGAAISITAVPQPGFPGVSDGKVSVGYIQAATFNSDELQVSGIDLASVTVDGDLAKISAGDQLSSTAIGRLDVGSLGVNNNTTYLGAGGVTTGTATTGQSVTFASESRVLGPIGTVIVHDDLAGYLHVFGSSFGSISSLKIGGALRGGSDSNSGRVAVSGVLSNATIGEILGGSGDTTGVINGLLDTSLYTSSIGTVTVLGDIIGGTGQGYTGAILAPKIGKVSARNIIGGIGPDADTVKDSSIVASGGIFSGSAISSITLTGDLIGGAGDQSGEITAPSIGTFSARNVIGGSGDSSGFVLASSGNINTIKLTGDLIGGAGAKSGDISVGGGIGTVNIAGELIGGSGDNSGLIGANGNITSFSAKALIGGAGVNSGGVRAGSNTGGTIGTISSLTLGKDATSGDSITGGSGLASGAVIATGNLTALTTAGNVRGGSANFTGHISANNSIDKLVLNGDLIGGDSGDLGAALTGSGSLDTQWLKSVTVNGNIKSGTKTGPSAADVKLIVSGGIAANRLDSLVVTGNLVGNVTNPVFVASGGGLSNQAIGNITINGNVEYAQILAGYTTDATEGIIPFSADASIGNVVFGGNVKGLDIVAGAQAGTDKVFGTADDTVFKTSSTATVADDLTIFSRIASVVFKKVGAIQPTTEAHGIVAQNVVAVTVAGVPLAGLKAGAFNDSTPLVIPTGSTSGFSVVEVKLV